jgi:hypothetical protein
MLPLDQVIAGAEVRGLTGATPVEVVRTERIGSDALNVVYRGADGPAEVLLFATPSRGLSLSGRPEPLALMVTGRHSNLPRLPSAFGVRTA